MAQRRRQSRTLGTTDLWRMIVEELDEGIIVFNDMGVSIYTNNEAARLLGYATRDVLDLDVDDLVALVYRRRLDGSNLARALLKDEIGEPPGKEYLIAMSDRRLHARPFKLALENGTVTILLLRDAGAWVDTLISDTVIDELYGPLSAASTYAQTLISRINEGNALPFELHDLARIISESVARAHDLWITASNLAELSPDRAPTLSEDIVDFEELMREVEAELFHSSSGDTPPIDKLLPDDLMPIKGNRAGLKSALLALLKGCAARLPQGTYLEVAAENYNTFIKVTVQPRSAEAALVNVAEWFAPRDLDRLPFAIAEQVVVRNGGRVWIDDGVFHCMIPASLPEQTPD